jgi:hypothetical protein
MPASVRKEIDHIRRAWLWRGEETCHGGHCKVAWSRICRPRELGGLGIVDLDRFGTALRLKWLWLERTTLDKPWIGMPVPCSLADRQLFAAASSVTVGDGPQRGSGSIAGWTTGRLSWFSPSSSLPPAVSIARSRRLCMRSGGSLT